MEETAREKAGEATAGALRCERRTMTTNGTVNTSTTSRVVEKEDDRGVNEKPF